MRVRYTTLMLLSVIVAQATPPVTTTYDVIESVAQLRRTRQVVLATRDKDDQLRLMNDGYFDPLDSPYTPRVIDLVYDYSYSGHDDPYQFVYNGKTLMYTTSGYTLKWAVQDESGNWYFDISIDTTTHRAAIRPTSRRNTMMTAAYNGNQDVILKLGEKTTLPIYLYTISTKLANPPQIKINGTDIEITADAGCDIMYQLIPQTDITPHAATDGWHLWNADEWPRISQQYSGEVLLRAKAVYGDTESEIVEHKLTLTTTTSITGPVISVSATYYDLYGHSVDDIMAAPPGIYIKVQGQERKKYIKR